MNKKLKKLLYSDAYRYYGSNAKPFLWQLKDHTLFLSNIYRKAHFYYEKKSPLRFFYILYYQHLCVKYSFNISYKTCIGYGLALTHNGVFNINSGASLGNNCNICVGAMIGQENRGKREGCPIIGDKVWIGTNAIIVGRIKIGNNVLIAPGEFINYDIPDNSVVIGGKIISNLHATEEYITNEYQDY